LSCPTRSTLSELFQNSFRTLSQIFHLLYDLPYLAWHSVVHSSGGRDHRPLHNRGPVHRAGWRSSFRRAQSPASITTRNAPHGSAKLTMIGPRCHQKDPRRSTEGGRSFLPLVLLSVAAWGFCPHLGEAVRRHEGRLPPWLRPGARVASRFSIWQGRAWLAGHCSACLGVYLLQCFWGHSRLSLP
jgi:hypothetical protein